MDGKKATVVGIVALLIGILVGYLYWGYRVTELDALKKRLAEVQQAAAQEGAAATRLQQVEAQLKEMTERLNSERDMRQKLEALVSKKKK